MVKRMFVYALIVIAVTASVGSYGWVALGERYSGFLGAFACSLFFVGLFEWLIIEEGDGSLTNLDVKVETKLLIAALQIVWVCLLCTTGVWLMIFSLVRLEPSLAAYGVVLGLLGLLPERHQVQTWLHRLTKLV